MYIHRNNEMSVLLSIWAVAYEGNVVYSFPSSDVIGQTDIRSIKPLIRHPCKKTDLFLSGCDSANGMESARLYWVLQVIDPSKIRLWLRGPGQIRPQIDEPWSLHQSDYRTLGHQPVQQAWVIRPLSPSIQSSIQILYMLPKRKPICKILRF